MTFQDHKININGKELHLIDWQGSGETLICVHGLTANGHCWDKLAEALSQRVIAYDLPGRGDSATSDCGLVQHAQDIAAIMDALEVGRVTLVGHSLGAAVACLFAAKNAAKLERLVLVDGGMDPAPALIDAIQPSLDRIGQVFPSFSDYITFMRRTPFFGEWSPYWERYFYHDVAHRSDGSVVSKVDPGAVRRDIRALRETAVNVLHRKITVPTLVLWAPRGLELPGVFVLTREKGEEIAASIPGSRFVTVEDSNHYTILTKDQTCREIKKFLEGRCPLGRARTDFSARAWRSS